VELEDIYWLFDGWDELADQLYADWAAHVSEVEAVRRAFDEFNAGNKVFVSREAAEAYYDQLVTGLRLSLGALNSCATVSKDQPVRLPPPIPLPQWRLSRRSRVQVSAFSDNDILPHIQSWTEISGYRTSPRCINRRSSLSQWKPARL
jgi:hypothetical protein